MFPGIILTLKDTLLDNQRRCGARALEKEAFIPLSNILTRCAYCFQEFEGENVLVVVPIVENLSDDRPLGRRE